MSVTNDCIEGLDLLTTICIGNLYLFEGFKKKVLDGQEISLLCKRCKSSNRHPCHPNGVSHQTVIQTSEVLDTD
jgi:hypothetical protein